MVLLVRVIALFLGCLCSFVEEGIAAVTAPHQPGALTMRSDRFLLKVAREDFHRQHNRMAEKALVEILSDHPSSVLRGPALLLLARIHARRSLQKGVRNFREPLDYFRRAEEALPAGWDKGEILYRKGQYLIRQRFGAEGRGILGELLVRYPESPWAFRARLAIADSWREKGNLSRAEKVLMKARSKLTRSITLQDRIRYQYLLGHIRLDRGDLPGAESALLMALTLSKRYPYSHPGALFLLARTSYALHHNHRSANLFRTFNRFFPNDSRSGDAEYYLARISGRLGFPAHERARLREVMVDNPGTTAGHLAQIERIKLVFFQKSLQSSRKDLPELLARSIGDLEKIEQEERNRRIADEAVLLKARLLNRSGHWEKAFRETSRLESRVDPVSRMGKKIKLLEESLLIERISALSNPLKPRRLLALYDSYRYRLPGPDDPLAASLYLALAKAHRKVGKNNRAVDDLEGVLKTTKDPDILKKGRLLKFDWLIEDGRKSEAMHWAFEQAENHSRDSTERTQWYLHAFKLSQELKDSESERRILSGWMASGLPVSQRWETIARLGLLEIRGGRHTKGRDELLSALPELESVPSDASLLAKVLFYLGDEAFQRGARGESRTYWLKMLECCPSSPQGGWVTYQLGQMALAEGHSAEARRWFKKTVSQYPGEEVARVARLKIQSMTVEKKDGNP